MIPDTTAAYVEVSHSNLSDRWWAFLHEQDTDKVLAQANGATRAEALSELAYVIEAE